MIRRSHFTFIFLFIGLLLAACGALPAAEPTGSEGDLDPLGSGPIQPPEPGDEGPAARGATNTTSDVGPVCLSAVEGDLVRQINEYRATKNLPPVPASKSLTLVAQQHAWDSVNNPNSVPAPPAGMNCNLHSWSTVVNPALREGTWTAVCYTSDHAQAAGMWNKPREIAGYPADGIENSFASSGAVTAEGALTGWKNSPGHNAVITEQNGWGPFNAMGVGISGGIAHLWFGRAADPAGEASLCGGGEIITPPTDVPTVEPTAVPPTEVPTTEPTAVPPTDVPTTEPTAVPPTDVPTTEPTAVPPTDVPTTEPTAVPPTEVPTTEPTAVPPTEVPTTEPTAVPPTEVPTTEPTAVPPTDVPTTEPTAAPPTGEILNAGGDIQGDNSREHTFDVVQGGSYSILITPSSEFDVEPAYRCTMGGGSSSGSFDVGFEGESENTVIDAFGNGSCTVTVSGYQGSVGSYTILVTAQ